MVVFCELPLADISLIPWPNSVKLSKSGRFKFNRKTSILSDNGLKTVAGLLDEYLNPVLGFHLLQDNRSDVKNAVVLRLNNSLKDLGNEGYSLKVNSNVVLIEAYHPAGVFYGIQTLRQLLPVAVFSRKEIKDVCWNIPYVEIKDSPRFWWRGMHLDVSRHFMPDEFINKEGNFITEAFFHYIKPLIGELPNYVKLKYCKA